MNIIRQKLFVALPVILVLLFAVIFLDKIFNPGRDVLYSVAKEAYKNWNNYKAEKILKKLYLQNPRDSQSVFLYASTLLRQGNLKKAETLFSRLISVKNPYVLKSLLQRARTRFYLNELDEAEDDLKEAFDYAKKANDSLALAAVYNIKGMIEFNKLQYGKALRYQKKSLVISKLVKDKDSEADALRQIGVLYWYASKYDSAVNYFYMQALRIYKETKNKTGEATTLSDIGLIYKDKGKLEQNINYQLKAFGIRKMIGDKIGMADSYYFLSNSISMAGWRGSVIYAYTRKSYELSKQIGYKWGMEVAARALKNYYYENGEYSRKIFSISDGLDTVGEGIIYGLWNKTRFLRQKGDLKGLTAVFEKLVYLEDSLRYSGGEHVAMAWLASAYTYLGRFKEAHYMLNKSRGINGLNNYYEYITDTTEARLYMKEDKYNKAADLLFKIVRNCDSSYINYLSPRNNRITGDNLSGIQEHRSAAYSMLADVLYRLHDKRLFDIVQKERSFTFWFRSNTIFAGSDEQLRNPFEKFVGLLDKYAADPERYGDVQKLIESFEKAQENIAKINKVISGLSLKEKKVPFVSVDRISRKLKKNDVFVEYFIGMDNVFVFVIRDKIFKLIKLNTTGKKIKSLVELYISLIKRGYSNSRDKLWKGVSRSLYRILIQPVADSGLLKKNDHIIISPHKILYRLPFQTLDLSPADSAAKFMVERYNISYVPSPAFWLSPRNKKQIKFNSLIAIAPDTIRLSGTGRELSYIPRNYFKICKTLVNGEVSKSLITKAFGQYDIVHIASHAKCNPWFPLYSYIKCGDRNLKLYEILNKNIYAKLIILSACETGLSVSATGGEPDDEDFLSFSRAFLLKGADNVISSLWIVNDNAAAEIMKLFYSNMFPANHNPGNINSVELSLNKAQRQFIEVQRKSGKPVHPFYWGAFYSCGISK